MVVCDDLVIEARKPALAFGDQLRIEAARTVTGNRNLDLLRAGRHRLAAVAVAAVLSFRIITQMVIHLRPQARSARAFFCAFTRSPEYRAAAASSPVSN